MRNLSTSKFKSQSFLLALIATVSKQVVHSIVETLLGVTLDLMQLHIIQEQSVHTVRDVVYVEPCHLQVILLEGHQVSTPGCLLWHDHSVAAVLHVAVVDDLLTEAQDIIYLERLLLGTH